MKVDPEDCGVAMARSRYRMWLRCEVWGGQMFPPVPVEGDAGEKAGDETDH